MSTRRRCYNVVTTLKERHVFAGKIRTKEERMKGLQINKWWNTVSPGPAFRLFRRVHKNGPQPRVNISITAGRLIPNTERRDLMYYETLMTI